MNIVKNLFELRKTEKAKARHSIRQKNMSLLQCSRYVVYCCSWRRYCRQRYTYFYYGYAAACNADPNLYFFVTTSSIKVCMKPLVIREDNVNLDVLFSCCQRAWHFPLSQDSGIQDQPSMIARNLHCISCCHTQGDNHAIHKIWLLYLFVL